MNDPLQTYLGIKAGSLLAGFFGGLVKALLIKNITAGQALFSCIIGALTAGYLTPVAMHWLSGADVTGAEGAVGYAIGLTAMLIVEGIIHAVSRWKDNPKFPGKD